MKTAKKRGGFLEHSRRNWVSRAICPYLQADWGFSGVCPRKAVLWKNTRFREYWNIWLAASIQYDFLKMLK